MIDRKNQLDGRVEVYEFPDVLYCWVQVGFDVVFDVQFDGFQASFWNTWSVLG
jgi:hypothetical protein